MLRGFFKKTDDFFECFSKYLYYLGGIIIAAVMLLITVATISRYVFGHAMAWATEIGAYSLLLITFFGGPYLARNGDHINVDILPNLLKGKSEIFINLLNAVISLAVSIAIGYFGILTTIDAYVNKLLIVSFINTPRYILLSIITLGFLLMAISYLRIALKNISSLKK